MRKAVNKCKHSMVVRKGIATTWCNLKSGTCTGISKCKERAEEIKNESERVSEVSSQDNE